MDTNISSLLFYFIAFFACVASQTCERSHYQNCLNKLHSFTDRKDLLFASTAEQLKDECIQARSALSCVTSYTKKCLSPEERPKYTADFSGSESVTLGLCSEDDFKTSFLQSIPCLRNISSGLEHCKEKYERNQRDIILVEYEDKTHLQCCSFDGYRRCLLMVLYTQEDCRETASDFLTKLSDRMGGVLTQGTCSEHFERCTGPSSGIKFEPSKFIWIAALLLTFLAL
ncbi:uncharacterized protein [Parasteatoda tepidariorum]|uniref:uncharacterized protein n=1 Tax=Parasteatoda tepidariorum TaxID=114398 RepID=UPI0039BD79DB